MLNALKIKIYCFFKIVLLMLEINLNIMKMGFKKEKLIERFIILFVALMQVLDACLRKPRRDSKVRFSLLHFLVRDF